MSSSSARFFEKSSGGVFEDRNEIGELFLSYLCRLPSLLDQLKSGKIGK